VAEMMSNLLIPLRFNVKPENRESSISTYGPLASLTLDSYTVDIEVLDLRDITAKTIRFTTHTAQLQEQEMPSLAELRTDQREYLQCLRDSIDLVLSA
jgi:hypothetical protein